MKTLQLAAVRRGAIPDDVFPPLLATLKSFAVLGLPAADFDLDDDLEAAAAG
jgi:hypothetical protein